MYFDFQEPVRTLPPHRILALNRGERLECLKVTLEAPVEEIIAGIERQYITGRSRLGESAAGGDRRRVSAADRAVHRNGDPQRAHREGRGARHRRLRR